jgi:hypothetical protein
MLKPWIATLLLCLGACGPTPGTGPKLVRVYGDLFSAPEKPLANAPVVLTQVLSNGDRDVQQVVSDSAGRYTFRPVPAGTYRVRFSRQRVQLASSASSLSSAPLPPLEDTFESLTSHNFTFDGQQERVIQVAPMTPTWKTALQRTDNTFQWAAAPDAESYQLELRWSSGEPFFESPVLSGPPYTLANEPTAPQATAHLKVQLKAKYQPGPAWGYSEGLAL